MKCKLVRGWLSVLFLTGLLSADQRPNVLIVLADDLGYSDLGCYGGEIPTPHLDRLAARGVRFSAFNTSARCCPSRAALMTGLHPHQAGIGSFAYRHPKPGMGPAYTGHLLPTCATLAEMLGDVGYSTWMVGKWHMGIPGPIERGFQNYFGYKNFLAHSQDQWNPEHYVRLPETTEPELSYTPGDFYVTDVFTDYALEFLGQARKKEQPFLLYLAHSSPHFPIQAPKESIDRHVDTYRQGWDLLRSARLNRQKKLGLMSGDAPLPPRSMVPVDRGDIANGYPGMLNPAWESLSLERREDLARRMATFAAMVEHVDRGVGRILADLEAHGELDHTLIFFLSDNGACYEWGPFGFDGPSRKGTTTLHRGRKRVEIGQPGTHQSYGSGWANLGNTPLNMYKHFCHEGGLASPLIVSWPERLQAAAPWVRDPAHLMDIVPTVLDATGATYPQERQGQKIDPVEGVSLLPPIQGRPLPERSLAFEHQNARGLRRGKWKLVWGKRQPTEPTWELYDLDQDRSEQNNLASAEPERVVQLAREWRTWATRVGVDGFQARDKPRHRATAPQTIDASPRVAGRPIDIVIEARAAEPQGVLLAHGGRENGYALHFLDGQPAFDVRIHGKVTRLIRATPVMGLVRLEARLSADTMSLSVNRDKPMIMASPGLLPVQPKDPVSVGRDALTAAGDYEPPNPFNGMIISTRVEADGRPTAVMPPMNRAAIEAGLRSHERALYVKEGWIRDPYIVLGPDSWFYLTGTTPNPRDPREQSDPYNTGLGEESIVGWRAQVWRSRDMVAWESLGAPFSLQDGIWFLKNPERFAQVVESQWRLWAPELHWLGERWALVHTSPMPVKGANLSLSGGRKVQGPWENPMGAAIQRRHDPSLFQDDDGTWWMIWGATEIAPLKPDFSDFSAKPTRISPSGETRKMGHEGCLIRKIRGQYVLFGTGWSTGKMRQGSYNLYCATANRLTGPYSERKFVGRFLGHGTPFQDQQGRWWCTAFYNANVPPIGREGIETRDLSATAYTINQRGTTLVPLEVKLLENGELHIRAKDPAYATPGPDEAQSFEGF